VVAAVESVSTDSATSLTEQPSSRSKSGGFATGDSRRSQPEVADGAPVAVRGAVPLNPLASSVGPVLPAQAAAAATSGAIASVALSQKRRRRLAMLVGGGALLTVALLAGSLALKPKKVRLRVDTQGEVGAGTVRSDPPGIDCGDLCSERFAKGTRIRLQATAAPGYSFAGWTGDCQSQEPCSLQLRWDQEVGARFVRAATASPTPTAGPTRERPEPRPLTARPLKKHAH
jgi:hypothetical protein